MGSCDDSWVGVVGQTRRCGPSKIPPAAGDIVWPVCGWSKELRMLFPEQYPHHDCFTSQSQANRSRVKEENPEVSFGEVVSVMRATHCRDGSVLVFVLAKCGLVGIRDLPMPHNAPLCDVVVLCVMCDHTTLLLHMVTRCCVKAPCWHREAYKKQRFTAPRGHRERRVGT